MHHIKKLTKIKKHVSTHKIILLIVLKCKTFLLEYLKTHIGYVMLCCSNSCCCCLTGTSPSLWSWRPSIRTWCRKETSSRCVSHRWGGCTWEDVGGGTVEGWGGVLWRCAVAGLSYHEIIFIC